MNNQEQIIPPLMKSPPIIVDHHSNCTGGILSSQGFMELVVPNNKIQEARRAFEKRNWGDFNNKIIINKFDPLKVTPFSYDLSVGSEVVSLRTSIPQILPLPCDIEPGQSITIMTEEYIALPPSYAATVWPRYKMVQEGIFQSMVKIDPTWYGKIAVVVTNLSPRTYTLNKFDTFGTLIIFGLASPTNTYLWRLDELKEEYEDVVLPPDIMTNLTDLPRELDSIKFKDIAWLAGNSLRIRAPKFEDITNLVNLYENPVWKQLVADAYQKWLSHTKDGHRIIRMDSLGMDRLDSITRKKSYGKEIDLNEVEKQGVSDDKLRKAAKEYGKPFDLVYGIPNMVTKSIKSTLSSEVEAVVGKTVYVQVVTLVLRIISALTLVVALVSLIMKPPNGVSTGTETSSAFEAWKVALIITIIIILGLFILEPIWSKIINQLTQFKPFDLENKKRKARIKLDSKLELEKIKVNKQQKKAEIEIVHKKLREEIKTERQKSQFNKGVRNKIVELLEARINKIKKHK